MSHEQETLLETLYNFLKTQGYRPVAYDSSGKRNLAKYAVIIEFDFIKDGVNYGTARLSVDNSNTLTVYIDDRITKSPSAPSEDGSFSWPQLLKYLRDFSFGRLDFEVKDTDDWEYDMAKRKDSEKLDEGYYPINRNTSYSDSVPNVKIRIQHSKNLGEGEQRYRNVARIFIENANGERFMLETKKPGIARVYARHIAEGGRPYDDKWNHITNLVEDYTKMAGFVRATKNGQFNESTQNLVNEGVNHYISLRETLHKLSGKKGYNNYFENWTPTLNEGDENTDLSEMFISSSLDPRIESAMPILARLSSKINEITEMNEVTELDEWASNIIDEDLTPTGKVQVEKIVELLSDKLPVGPNADNAIPLLSDLNLENSELNEILKDLAEQDSDSDAVPAIKDWMKNSNDHKLHAIVNQLNGEAQDESNQQGVAEDQLDEDDYDDAVSAFLAKGGKLQKGKTHKPRKSERLGGSRHIGGSGEKMKSSRTGISSKPIGKAVAGEIGLGEQGITEGPKEVLKLMKFAKGGGILGGKSLGGLLDEEGMEEGSDVTKLNDYDQWLDRVDALGAEKHVQKNRTTIIAQSWDGERVGEFDTRAGQGWVMSQGVTENVDIGREWMTDTEIDQYIPEPLQQDWRELLGYDENGNTSKYWAFKNEPDMHSDIGRVQILSAANLFFRMKKIPLTAFDFKDIDDELEWLVQVGPRQEVAVEGLDKDQKQAGQLGPTDKVTTGAILGKEPKSQKGLRGKLVGASESVDPLIAIRRLSGFEK